MCSHPALRHGVRAPRLPRRGVLPRATGGLAAGCRGSLGRRYHRLGHVPEELLAVPLHPSPLYECFLGVLLYLVLRRVARARLRRAGHRRLVRWLWGWTLHAGVVPRRPGARIPLWWHAVDIAGTRRGVGSPRAGPASLEDALSPSWPTLVALSSTTAPWVPSVPLCGVGGAARRQSQGWSRDRIVDVIFYRRSWAS